MNFYLGTHMPHWLRFAKVPLFVALRTIKQRCWRNPPRAAGPWGLDSNGFTQLHMYGGWTFTEAEYVTDVRRCHAEIGQLQFAAPMDWMCEEVALSKTGLSVPQHQRLTIENYLTLKMLAPDLPFIPVLQGWTPDDYLRHVDQYVASGVDLAALPLVGLGSVCRRQHTVEIERLIFRLWQNGLRLHGFGFKVKGLARSHDVLASADSMAWSFNARKARRPLIEGHTHSSCANCFEYAMRWRDDLLAGDFTHDLFTGIRGAA
jgi:hypothetical protein